MEFAVTVRHLEKFHGQPVMQICSRIAATDTLAEKSIGPLGFFVIGLFVSLKKAACAPYVAEQSLFYLSIMFKSLSCQ